jgi:hypothetical protein
MSLFASSISLQETQALPRVYLVAESLLSGPQHRIALPRAALGTVALTALTPLPRVGPSAGRDPRHNQVFTEGQRSARMAPSEKERAPSHLGCRPPCRRLCRWAIDTDATCAESRGPALGKAVDHGLPRLTGLCRELGGAVGTVHLFAGGPPSAQVPMPRAPLGSRQRSNSFFIFGLSFFIC